VRRTRGEQERLAKLLAGVALDTADGGAREQAIGHARAAVLLLEAWPAGEPLRADLALQVDSHLRVALVALGGTP
jgi:hypothetical protein